MNFRKRLSRWLFEESSVTFTSRAFAARPKAPNCLRVRKLQLLHSNARTLGVRHAKTDKRVFLAGMCPL
jgi:hypothetical protein